MFQSRIDFQISASGINRDSDIKRVLGIVNRVSKVLGYRFIDNPSIRPRSKGSYSKVIDLKLKLIKESNWCLLKI